MQFTQGQIVVYPHHGPATVTAITDREVKGVTARYLVLSVHKSALTVSAPIENAERRQQAKGLSLAEKDMLRYAKGPVVTGIALSMGVDTERADEVLDNLLLGTPLEARDQVAA